MTIDDFIIKMLDKGFIVRKSGKYFLAKRNDEKYAFFKSSDYYEEWKIGKINNFKQEWDFTEAPARIEEFDL